MILVESIRKQFKKDLLHELQKVDVFYHEHSFRFSKHHYMKDNQLHLHCIRKIESEILVKLCEKYNLKLLGFSYNPDYIYKIRYLLERKVGNP